MKKFAALLLFLLLNLVPCAREAAGGEPKAYQMENAAYQACLRANALMNGQKYAEAIEVLQRAAESDPTSYSGNVHLTLARCHMALKQYDVAIVEAKTALTLDPKSIDAYYELANICYKANRYDEAISFLGTYIDQTPDAGAKRNAQNFMREIGSYGNLFKARKFYDKDQMAEAKRCAAAAARYDPSKYSGAIHALIATIESRELHVERALEEGRLAMKFDPHEKLTVYLMVKLSSDVARFDDAIKYLNQYISMEQDDKKRDEAASTLQQLERDREDLNSSENASPDYLNDDGRLRKWQRHKIPIKVCISKTPKVYGYRDSFPNMVKLAFDTWCKDSKEKLDYVLVEDRAKADITVKFVQGPIEADDDHSARPVGICYRQSLFGYLDKCEVNIRTVDPFDEETTVTDSQCASVAMHEVGHSLGLNHSKGIRDVMYWRTSPIQSGPPTARDSATLALIYQDYPAVGFVPKSTASSTNTKFIPLPTFMPPALPDTSKIIPPMFMPPPLREKLIPPMFTPPPLQDGAQTTRPSTPAMPMFIPPPLRSGGAGGASKVKPKQPSKQRPSNITPFFTPPPLK